VLHESKIGRAAFLPDAGLPERGWGFAQTRSGGLATPVALIVAFLLMIALIASHG
jgi:hypothetical protein